jgi:polyhydroxyalkanoate synthase
MWLGAQTLTALATCALGQSDELRRRCGDLLDLLGFGPITTPSRIVLSLPGMQLRDYGGPADALVFVIIPAPIKRAYIWDLAPGASVVQQLGGYRMRRFLVEWVDCAAQATLRLSDYADRLIEAAIDEIERRTGQSRVILAGHSLGGTLAAIFAALHPSRVRGLVLLEAPTKFADDAGAFAPLIAATPVGAVRRLFDVVPGTVLDLASVAGSPLSFLGARWLDRLASAGDPDALITQLRVERWMLDELPLSGGFLDDVIEALYREDRFLPGRLTIWGTTASAAALTMPLLSVMRPDSLVAPPTAIRPLHDAAPSADKRLLRYDGDRGVALRHVGILVGRRAHREVWPEILQWTHRIANIG